MKKTVIKNELKCTKCGDMIYSAYSHDLKYCKCGAVERERQIRDRSGRRDLKRVRKILVKNQ